MAAKGIQQVAMGRSVHQRAVIVLAVDFHQRLTQLPHQRDAGRLVVDKDARAPVGILDTPQDDVAIV